MVERTCRVNIRELQQGVDHIEDVPEKFRGR